MASVVCFCHFRRLFSCVFRRQRQSPGSAPALSQFTECFVKFHTGTNNQRDDLQSNNKEEVEEFRTYEIKGLKPAETTKRFTMRKRPVTAPRSEKMPTDQDWTNVWPAQATFKHSVVPLPLRQGVSQNSAENAGVSPAKQANAELMKIPNFLHLTPAHITKHCQAIKQFCSEWPAGLRTDEDCHRHFPVEVMTSDYLFSAPSIRDARARTVTVTMKLSTLELDDHARDKFISLVGDRYDKATDTLTMRSERCPTKKQNYDCIQYLLTALYFESWKTESWEADRTVQDMPSFTWEMTPSKTTVINTLKAMQKNKDHPPSDENLTEHPDVISYRDAVTQMADEGENAETLRNYKRSVLDMLKIPVKQ